MLFWKKKNLPQKLEKWAKKQDFLIFFEKIGHWFLLHLFIYCVSAQILYLGKFLSLRYGPKMFSANQIAWFFNQAYFQNK